MKLTCRILAALCLPLMLCGPALAQHAGPYLGGYVGGNALMSAKSSDDLGSFKLTFDPALLGSAVVGWDFKPGNPVGEGRIEMEYTHRSNRLDKATFAEGSFTGGGAMTADSLLLNFFGVYHDKSRFLPYLGVGIGVSRMKASNVTLTSQPLSNGSSVVLAYQAGTGIDVVITDNVTLDIGYRFFSAVKPKFNETSGHAFTMDYYNHSAVLGLRVGF